MQVRNNDLVLVKKLINDKADLEMENKHKKTALLFAYKKEHLEIVNLLLTAKADINKKDKFGNSLLIYVHITWYAYQVVYFVLVYILTSAN
jgi:ankyrin repeat protein